MRDSFQVSMVVSQPRLSQIDAERKSAMISAICPSEGSLRERTLRGGNLCMYYLATMLNIKVRDHRVQLESDAREKYIFK